MRPAVPSGVEWYFRDAGSHLVSLPAPTLVEVTSQAPELHITIIAAGGGSDLVLTHEIELVKAAVLYADRVTLASPRATMIGSIGALGGLAGRDRTEALLEIASQMPDAHDLHVIYTTLERKKHKTKDELLALRRIERELAAAGDQLSVTAAEIATDAGLDELIPAIEEEVLDLHPLGLDKGGDVDAMVQQVSQLVAQVVSPDSSTLPMFDDGSGGLLGAMLKEGVIPQARLEPAAEAAVAGRFVSWLPAFPDADLDTVLTARSELRDPLIRYRSAIVGLTRDLEALPIDDDFESIVRELYRQHVEPALLEIEELSRELGLQAGIASAMRSGAGRRVAEAAVGFAAADAAGIPPLLVSALGVGADIVAQLLKDRSGIKRSQRENQFFFLYEADRTLGGR